MNHATLMKALVFRGPNRLALEDRPRPSILEATDAIVRITTTTLCGTDLHILKGDVPSITDGRILGHEGVGIVEEVGTNVLGFHPGDKVLVSLITSCGMCAFAKRGCIPIVSMEAGGWATALTALRPNTSGFLLRTAACTGCRPRRMTKRW